MKDQGQSRTPTATNSSAFAELWSGIRVIKRSEDPPIESGEFQAKADKGILPSLLLEEIARDRQCWTRL